MIGLSKSIDKYEALTKEVKTNFSKKKKKDSLKKKEKKLTVGQIDSIKQKLNVDLKNSFIPESARKKILEEVDKNIKDTTNLKKNGVNFDLEETRLNDFSDYVKKNPNSKIDIALDSLGYDKNFTNRFLFIKAKKLHSFTESKDSRDEFFSEVLSYGSFALFIFLPFFTLFLKFFFIRRNYTYVDHLIFVFHIQTVFFMLFSIFIILEILDIKPDLRIFLTLFSLYLIIAMKQFYQQGYFRTFVKFLLLNMSYFIIGAVGVIFVFLISFALF